ncbi:hypothetical protein D3C71_1615130 [compost metagenome]
MADVFESAGFVVRLQLQALEAHENMVRLVFLAEGEGLIACARGLHTLACQLEGGARLDVGRHLGKRGCKDFLDGHLVGISAERRDTVLLGPQPLAAGFVEEAGRLDAAIDADYAYGGLARELGLDDLDPRAVAQPVGHTGLELEAIGKRRGGSGGAGRCRHCDGSAQNCLESR